MGGRTDGPGGRTCGCDAPGAAKKRERCQTRGRASKQASGGRATSLGGGEGRKHVAYGASICLPASAWHRSNILAMGRRPMPGVRRWRAKTNFQCVSPRFVLGSNGRRTTCRGGRRLQSSPSARRSQRAPPIPVFSRSRLASISPSICYMPAADGVLSASKDSWRCPRKGSKTRFAPSASAGCDAWECTIQCLPELCMYGNSCMPKNKTSSQRPEPRLSGGNSTAHHASGQTRGLGGSRDTQRWRRAQRRCIAWKVRQVVVGSSHVPA